MSKEEKIAQKWKNRVEREKMVQKKELAFKMIDKH